MADWNNPTVGSQYDDFPDEVRELAISAASMDYTSDTNVPDGVLKYDRTLKKFYLRVAGAWVEKQITGLADDSVFEDAIQDDAVTTVKILDEAITIAKIDPEAIDGDAATDIASVALVQNNTFNHAGTVGGTANAITLTVAPTPAAYVAGQIFTFLATITNTGSTSVNVNSIGAITVYRTDGNTLNPGDIRIGQMHIIVMNDSLSAFTLVNCSRLPVGVLYSAGLYPVGDNITATDINLREITWNNVTAVDYFNFTDGHPCPYPTEVTALSLYLGNGAAIIDAGSLTIELWKSGIATGKTVTISAGASATNTFTPQAYAVNEVIHLKATYSGLSITAGTPVVFAKAWGYLKT